MQQPIRRYTQDYPCLNLTALIKNGYLSEDQNGESRSIRHGKTIWAFAWHVKRFHIELYYSTPNNQSYQRVIQLIHQQPNYGGQRYYLKCPTCGEKRKQLYIVTGEPACRLCHQLHYRSQSESSYERAGRRLDKLLTKVDSSGYRFGEYQKPKGQHWKTYRGSFLLIQQLKNLIVQMSQYSTAKILKSINTK